MKISINLLPPEKKAELARKNKLKLFVWQETILAGIVVVFLAMLASANWILKIQLESARSVAEAEKVGPAFQEVSSLEGELRKLNMRISALHDIGKKNLRWSWFFQELDKVITDDTIVFYELSTKNFQIFVSGRANSRDDLLKLQTRINIAPCFADANVPLSNLVTKDNVDFQIDFRIKEECMKNAQ